VSSFICKHCGQEIIDSESGYRTGCEHYPLEEKSDIPCAVAKLLGIEGVDSGS